MISKTQRSLLVGLLFAVVGGAIAYRAQFLLHAHGGDFVITWRAARVLAAGSNPYEAIRPLDGLDWKTYWFYPLPAALFAAPVAWLDPERAAFVFVTLSSGLLGFALAQLNRPWLPVLVSVPFWFSAQLAQMSALIMALGMLCLTAGLAFLKPNLGVALFAWRPSRITLAVAAAITAVSVIAFPHWPTGWLSAAARSTSHSAPILRGVGAVGLLSILRWRRAEARLLFCLTLVPNAVWFYDELPLFLVPASPRQAVLLSLGSWAAWMAWFLGLTIRQIDPTPLNAGGWITLGMYLPATVMVLLRPNEGELPDRFERLAGRLPVWLRGYAVAGARERSDSSEAHESPSVNAG